MACNYKIVYAHQECTGLSTEAMPQQDKCQIIRLLLFLSPLGIVLAAPAFDVDTIKTFLPTKGETLHDEIRCYALPYGAIGLVSHILTFYTIACLRVQRSPFKPWRELEHLRFDIFLAVCGLFFGFGLTIFTMIRCHQRWQFLVIAIWKAVLSITLGGINLHAAIRIKSDNGRLTILLWGIFYGLGMALGLAGLGSLANNAWVYSRVIRLVTVAFGGVTGGSIALTILYSCCCGGGWEVLFRNIFLIFGILPALYSDWVLAGLANNLIGVPSSDNMALYIGYFVAKRFPFFSL
jgi:hypothetical protein